MNKYKDIKPLKLRENVKFVYPDGEVLKGKIIDEIG